MRKVECDKGVSVVDGKVARELIRSQGAAKMVEARSGRG